MLGKRKREVTVARRSSTRNEEVAEPFVAAITPANDQTVFRRHFESSFEPLHESQIARPSSGEGEGEDEEGSDTPDEASDEESDWEGLSETGSGLVAPIDAVEVVEHRSDTAVAEDIDSQRRQYKTFMSSRPPKEVERANTKRTTQETEEEDSSEAVNLKHDLDLQRLLKESHLLEQAKSSSSLGAHRHKAVDMRMQSLGSKGSMFHQESMPMAHRRGILAKASARDTGRRTEARENGIILEKATGRSRAKEVRRERAVDAPAVGKFRGGTLSISKKDVFDIQGPTRSGPRGKARRQ